jgi:hypothetical protein
MDGFTPHPPTDLAVYVFFALSRIYFTSNQPFDFFKGIPQERLISHAKFESFRARKILFDLFLYCQSTIAKHPYQHNLLTNAYLYAVATVHAKFHTNQDISPFIPPTL